jgi:hypothetical protein
MAKSPDGILSPVHGSVGNFTFYQLNGQSIVRRKAKFIDKPTAAQLNSRGSMKTLMNFLTRIKPFIKFGYMNQSRGTKRSYFNLAMSYNLKQAMKLEPQGFVIDYTKVKLSAGSLSSAEQATAALNVDGLLFNWHADPGLNWSSKNDQVMMMAYFPEEDTGIYQTSGAKRMAGQDVLSLPPSYLGKRMEVYLSFVADDRCAVSDSQYLGSVN